MSRKTAKIAGLIAACQGRDLDAHYLAYFECFNQQLFFEAHDVLEELWLSDRRGSNGDFYKGLIQLAGAFVHLQKGRLRAADALFQLAGQNLTRYPARHEQLDVAGAMIQIQGWRRRLEQDEFRLNPLASGPLPHLRLGA